MKPPSTNPTPHAVENRLHREVERRAAERLRPASPAVCEIRLADGTVGGRGIVDDISTTGIRFLIGHGWGPGTEVGLVIRSASSDFGLTVRLRVLRCIPLPDGRYSVAGRFGRRLAPAELQSFLS